MINSLLGMLGCRIRIIFDPSQQNRALVRQEKKLWYSFYLKDHLISLKMIPLMCKLDAALQFYGEK